MRTAARSFSNKKLMYKSIFFLIIIERKLHVAGFGIIVGYYISLRSYHNNGTMIEVIMVER